MRINSKLLILTMLVVMIACVSAVSATDINGTDDVSDNIVDGIIDDAAIDEVSNDAEVDEIDDVVEEDTVDDSQDNDVEKENLRPTSTYYKVNSSNVGEYFNTSTGEVLNTRFLDFTGTFNNVGFSNFVINKNIGLKFTNAVFINVGFVLSDYELTIDGATFNINAPADDHCYAIYVKNANNTQILNNMITYTCGHKNPDNYNYVIKVENSTGVKATGNTITATLPLKDVKHYTPGIEGLDKDFVAGVGVTNSNYFNFTNNTVDITANLSDGDYPTLDAIVIWYSNNSYIEKNIITVKDIVTQLNQKSYIYGVDAFECSNLTVDNNTITMNADNSGGYVGGNGTGAAYCVQLTGPYNGTIVSNNILTTKNHGPNAAIYSQNWNGETNVTIANNTISVTGKGTAQTWDVLTGIELQDNYATVTGNTITVNNIDSYSSGYNVYGISYCQYSPGTHTYIITDNTVTVNNGFYTVYIMDGFNCNVTGNTLNSHYSWHHNSGNSTVYVAGTGNYVGPNP